MKAAAVDCFLPVVSNTGVFEVLSFAIENKCQFICNLL